MEDLLPTKFDVIVVGTGMTESIIAAAASRIGKQVLHIDGNDFYGASWASFNLEALFRWVKSCSAAPSSLCNASESDVKINNEEKIVSLMLQRGTATNIETNWFIPVKQSSPEVEQWSRKSQTVCTSEENEDSSEDCAASETHNRVRYSSESEKMPPQNLLIGNWTQEEIMKIHHKFNIDLSPKLLFARGTLVELLITSNIARYTEFHAVNRVLTWLDGALSYVPCSRADVFSTRDVSVVEKRMLMKLLTSCMETDNTSKEFEGFEDKTFLEYLKSKRLTPHLLHYVLYAIAMGTDTMPCLEAVKRTQQFLNSLGRYGNTPFLWPMYGTGEIPQAFCRLCAVFGGVYCLQHPAKALITSNDVCVGVESCGQRLTAEHFVIGIAQAPSVYVSSAPKGGISRGIFITNKSILPSEKEQITLLQFPPSSGRPYSVTIIEVGPGAHACPKGLYVVHMTCRQLKTAKEDLHEVVECLLREKTVKEEDYCIPTDTQSTQTKVGSAQMENLDAAGLDQPPMEGSDPKPQVLWSLYFNHPDTNYQLSSNTPQNVHFCSGPDLELDFEFAVQQAKDIFHKMFPDEEFLPRAPDPEEIVIEDDMASTKESAPLTENLEEQSSEKSAELVDTENSENSKNPIEGNCGTSTDPTNEENTKMSATES